MLEERKSASGKKYLIHTDFKIVDEFLKLEGEKLFLNAADLYYDAHGLGRKVDKICRNHNIPSLTNEHSSFAMAGTLRENLKDKILFCAARMAVHMVISF